MALPSLNASFLLKCFFKPEGRAWAAEGGPEASINRFDFALHFLTEFIIDSVVNFSVQLHIRILNSTTFM